jgi:TRAP-type C4-dicarboxylate transport system substrate-binding protein
VTPKKNSNEGVEIVEPEAKKAKQEYMRNYMREYMREWKKKNPDKVKAISERYWKKKAEQMKDNTADE